MLGLPILPGGRSMLDRLYKIQAQRPLDGHGMGGNGVSPSVLPPFKRILPAQALAEPWQKQDWGSPQVGDSTVHAD